MHSSRTRPDRRLVVIGCGGLGSAATYWLSRAAGGRVLALERHGLGHDHGASQDHSRIIRYAQHQDAYAALAPAAYAAWRDVERVSAQTLVTETGGLVIEDVEARSGLDTGGRNIGGYAAVADRHGVDFDLLDARGIEARWPQFRLAGTEQAMYQRRTGIVDAAPRQRHPRRAGPRARRGDPRALPGARPAPHPRRRRGRARRRGGPRRARRRHRRRAHQRGARRRWSQIPLTVLQEQVTYYATPNLLDFSPARFPVFMWHGADNFYGFPVYGEVATKLGQHMGGNEVTADSRTFEPDPLRQKRQEAFLAEHLPGFGGPELYTKTCLYTIPPDQHYVIDTVPGEPRVSVGVGAGHAFKFASLIGKILADLATTGGTRHPIDAFGLDRPALTDPSWGRAFHV